MQSLKGLSDRELVTRLRRLVQKEQALTIAIIPHLVEVTRRGLHLAQGYGSLYEYCKGELGYSDASAWRRARAAQAVLRCPEAWDRLREGRVSLCTLGRVHKFITPAVLKAIGGKSKAEVEWIAAAYDAKGAAPDRTRAVMVPRAPERSGAGQASAAAPAANTLQELRGKVPAESDKQDLPPSPQDGLRREVTLTDVKLSFEQKWKIEAVVSMAVKAKLDRCKALLSRKYPRGVDYEVLLGELAEMFLEHRDPERRHERRKQRQVQPKRKRPAEAISNTPVSRHITAREKEKVWIRDKGRCAYIGTNGKRCASTHNLQFDHYPVPFARGGPSTAGNLRLLCARHNRFTAYKIFGEQAQKKRPLRLGDVRGGEKAAHAVE
jgi:5-methylcytosine-specific restriction endonuclease McrA